MEKHKLDSLLKNAINESNDFYDSDAELAKERIWNKIKPQKKVIPLFYRLLAVASILLLILLSVSTYSNLHYKSSIKELVETNKQLKLDKNNLLSKNETSLIIAKSKKDTVYIEKKSSNTEPVVTTKYITDTVYLKEIVYIEKKKDSTLNSSKVIASDSNAESNTNSNSSQKNVKVKNSNDEPSEKDKSNLIAEVLPKSNSESNLVENITETNALKSDSNSEDENSFQKDIIIKSDDVKKDKKSRKFRIQFGGSRSKIGEETLALQTAI